MIRSRQGRRWSALLAGVMVGLFVSSSSEAAGKAESDTIKQVQENYGNLPLSFEVNQGQAPSQVKFLSRGPGYGLFLTPGEAVLSLTKPSDTHEGETDVALVSMRLLGAKAKPEVVGLELMPGKSNYFIGNDPSQWHTNVSHYGKVKYRSVYPGIDLVYYGNQRQLEYDFVVAPGADPRKIAMAFAGVDTLEIDAQGDLVLTTQTGVLRQHKPIVYQEVNGTRKLIEGRYVLKGANEVGFQVARYDAKKPLVIDPVLAYATYLGSCGASPGGCVPYTDAGYSIAVDGDGNAYLTGETHGFPTTGGAMDTTCGGPQSNGAYGSWSGLCFNMWWGSDGGGTAGYASDGFVTKLNPTGTQLVYSTYLGGAQIDKGQGIVVDSLGYAYVVGLTRSWNFPVTAGSFDVTCGCTQYVSDAFVVKLNPTGSGLVYGTFLGGSGIDGGYGIAVDASGNAYVTGGTRSTNFPTLNPFQPAFAGGGTGGDIAGDAFIAKLNATGTALLYSTYLGGSSRDIGLGIAVNSEGNAYVTGYASSTAFPTTSGGFDPVHNGGNDAFVTKLSASGSSLVYSTYVGGNGSDVSNGIVIDTTGNAYITGTTTSTNFPFTASGSGSFVAELNASGSAVVFANSPGGYGIVRDCSGNIYAVGGIPDVVVTKRDPSGALVYTYSFGGSGDDVGYGIAVDCVGNVFVTGLTASTDFPTTAGTVQPAFGGGPNDAFVAKISEVDTIQFSASAYSVTENGVYATITVTRSGTQSGEVSATWATSDGTATAPADYYAGTGLITFPAGDTTAKTFNVFINEDALLESDETVNLTLSNPTGGAALGAPSTAVLTILDNDSPGTVQFSSSTYSVNEGDNFVVITVTRTGGSAGPVSLNYATSDGTAICPADYACSNGPVTFGDGDATPKTISIPITDDSLIEGSETFNITLTGTPLGTPSTAVVTIVDNDAPLLLSQGQPTTASSWYSTSTPDKAVDGNIATLWNSGGFAPRWIYVDLGSVRPLAEVRVLAGVGSPSGTTYYNIDVSNDATNWTTVTSASNASTTTYTVSPVSTSARYVRIYITSHSGGSWVGLLELQVYGF